MGKYNFLQPYLWFNIQNYILKAVILFSVKLFFFLLQTINTITPEKLIQLNDLRIIQLLATLYDCSEQYNPRHFSVTRVHKWNQAPSANEYTRTFASVYIHAKVTRVKTFRCCARFKKLVYFVSNVHMTKFINMVVWIGILILCLYQKIWTLMNIVPNLNGKDSA